MTDSLSPATVRGMVATLRPAWSVRSLTQLEQGTDSVVRLAVSTPSGECQMVLKAATADHVPTPAALAEPRMLERITEQTSIPVPALYGYRDEHPDYPAPFYLMDHVSGATLENDYDALTEAGRERVLSTAGDHLAQIHELGTWSATGRIGVRDGQFRVIESADTERQDDSREWVLAHAESAIDSLPQGGYFPDYADDPKRFADLVPQLRSLVRERIPALPEPDSPRWANGDYRYGNLVIDAETGGVRAVLDWGMVSAIEPAYNLAIVESMLLSPDRDSPERTATLRKRFRTSYTDGRAEWSFDRATRERMTLYRLVYRLNAMACFGLWNADKGPAERDEQEREHREFVATYL